MQKLVLDPSWNKALADHDRQEILALFEETKDEKEWFSPLWSAVNYKKDLLITVMIHNITDHAVDFSNAALQYKENGTVIAHYVFHLPNVKLESEESTVWTFIFPVGSRNSLENPTQGILTFAEK